VVVCLITNNTLLNLSKGRKDGNDHKGISCLGNVPLNPAHLR
jgi:hypothetical protein